MDPQRGIFHHQQAAVNFDDNRMNCLPRPILTIPQGIQIRVRSGLSAENQMAIRAPEKYLFYRTFNPQIDALYIPLERWISFCEEPTDRFFQPDLHEQTVDVHSDIVSIAVPDSFLSNWMAVSWLAEIEHWFANLRVMYVIIGEQPDVGEVGSWRWEVQGAENLPYFSWENGSDDLAFCRGGQAAYDEGLFAGLFEETRNALVGELMNSDFKRFEVRPVMVVKR
jgi:hypothetical protein